LEDQIENTFFKGVISSVLGDVKEGTSFSKALTKYPRVFPDIYLSMVEAAEISGNLPEVLNRVSVYLEKSSALRKKVKSALYYPAAIVIMAIIITGFLMFKVIPTFKQIFASLGGALPLPTQILITVSDALTKKETLIGIILILFLGGIGLKKYLNTPKGKLNFHRFILKLPLVGELIRKVALANFSRTFATLMRSGVSIVQGLDIVARTSGNKVIEEAVLKSKKFIQQGQPIYLPLEESGVFPPMVVKMIAVGERSGRLEGMLLKIAQFYEEQTDAMVAGLSSLIEPVIIVFLGVVVGGIVVALFLPILKITQYLGGV
jgi:type IV pilus assembly protein PilC